MWPSRSSKRTLPPPDPPFPPKGLLIPMTQTLPPSMHPLTLPQVIQTPPESPADSDLDNTEPCEAFTFDDSTLEHIMDTYSPTYSINKTHIYHVSKHSSSHYGSFIDRGANGGLAGSDVRILERTGRTVSVTGIDNHELPGLDIVTCAALCRILGLTALNSLLQYVNWLVWEIVLSTEWSRTRRLDYNDLNWPRCSAQVTESLALTDGGFCQSKKLYILDYVKFVRL